MRRMNALRQSRSFATATVIVGLSVASVIPAPSDPRTRVPWAGSSRVFADSTGKMSTKLTAKKRYLPRIQKGINAFRENKGAMKKDDFASFVRAMNLYGASLRLGEIPDAISRQAEDLTIAFSKVASADKMDEKQYEMAIKAFDEYLRFASLHGEDITKY